MITDSLQVFKSIPEIRAASSPQLFFINGLGRRKVLHIECLIHTRYPCQEGVIHQCLCLHKKTLLFPFETITNVI